MIWSWRSFTSAWTFGSRDRTAYGNTYSSGSISSLQNCSTQSSFSWNSGSVEKSHAMCTLPCCVVAMLPRAYPVDLTRGSSGRGGRFGQESAALFTMATFSGSQL